MTYRVNCHDCQLDKLYSSVNSFNTPRSAAAAKVQEHYNETGHDVEYERVD